jgi:hypothetical protein
MGLFDAPATSQSQALMVMVGSNHDYWEKTSENILFHIGMAMGWVE